MLSKLDGPTLALTSPNPHQVLSLVFASGPLVSMLGPALGGILYGALGARF